MTDYQVLELIGMHVSQVDTAFEFWLTISFGVLVALHIARLSITRQLKLLLCFLYLSATLIAVFHTVGDLLQAFEYIKLIEQESPAHLWNAMGGLLRMFVYAVGTASVSVAIFRYDSWVGDNET